MPNGKGERGMKQVQIWAYQPGSDGLGLKDASTVWGFSLRSMLISSSEWKLALKNNLVHVHIWNSFTWLFLLQRLRELLTVLLWLEFSRTHGCRAPLVVRCYFMTAYLLSVNNTHTHTQISLILYMIVHQAITEIGSLTWHVLAETWDGVWTWQVSGLRHAEVSRLKKVASAPLLVKVTVREIVWPTTCKPKLMNWLSTSS